MEKTTQAGTTKFVYQGANLLSELNQANASVRDYIWFAGKPVALVSYAANGSPAALYAIHFDHLGTSQAITDQNQQIVWQAQDTPFGEATLVKADITNHLRFARQYFDTETQLHYNWNRYYDPRLGRYITSDPIGLAGGMSTFGYANQNPILMFDPFGLCPAGMMPNPYTNDGVCIPSNYNPGSNSAFNAAGFKGMPPIDNRPIGEVMEAQEEFTQGLATAIGATPLALACAPAVINTVTTAVLRHSIATTEIALETISGLYSAPSAANTLPGVMATACAISIPCNKYIPDPR